MSGRSPSPEMLSLATNKMSKNCKLSMCGGQPELVITSIDRDLKNDGHQGNNINKISTHFIELTRVRTESFERCCCEQFFRTKLLKPANFQFFLCFIETPFFAITCFPVRQINGGPINYPTLLLCDAISPSFTPSLTFSLFPPSLCLSFSSSSSLCIFSAFTLYVSLFLNSSSFVFLWDSSSHFLNFILGSLYHSVFATSSWHTSTLFHSRSFSPACTQSTLHLSHSLTHTLSFTLSLSFFMSLVHSSPHSLLDPPSTIHMWRS